MIEKTLTPPPLEGSEENPRAKTNRPPQGATVSWEGGRKRKLDLTDQRFGRWTVVSEAGSKNGHALWLCRCECGTKKTVPSIYLRTHQSKSCGCWKQDFAGTLNYSHGKSRTKIYSIWTSMLQRCENPDDQAFADYGGRGIKVCERWHKFENFFSDMGEKPRGKWIERKDNEKGYGPDNCVWATPTQQANNRRNNLVVTLDGITGSVLEHANRLGVPYHTVYNRVKIF